MKEDIIRKLTSRKLWAMIAQFVVALLIFFRADKTQAQEIGSLIMMAVAPVAYIIGEAWVDSGEHTIVNYNAAEEDEDEDDEDAEGNG